MDINQILALYDRHERREAVVPGFGHETTANLVRQLAPGDGPAMVIYSQLSEATADDAIRGEIAYFTGLGRDFEWKWYAHDQPADLCQRLAGHGFTIGEDEAIMALDLAELLERLRAAPAVEIRRITDPDGLGDVELVQSLVWGVDVSRWMNQLATSLRDSPEYVSVYAAYLDGEPACSAWINFPPNTPFASLWGGSTRAEHRGRGVYTALLAIRAQEAIRRGYRYLTIDASPMSRPIVERLNFRLLTLSRPCEYGV